MHMYTYTYYYHSNIYIHMHREELYTGCVQIFAGRIFRERPAPNNFRDFNFVNGGLQQQSCPVCVHIFVFLF